MLCNRAAHYSPHMQKGNVFKLCLIEGLERVALYSFVIVFVPYLGTEHGMSEMTAATFMANFFLLSYLIPLFGGVLADRVVGQRRSIALGAGFLALGYTLLAAAGPSSLYPALAALLLGMAIFKPALSATLANLYPRFTAGRETAFLLFFLALQLGSFAAPFASEFAQSALGLAGSFAMSAAALGLIGLVLLVRRRHFAADPPAAIRATPESRTHWALLIMVYLISMLHQLVVNGLVLSMSLFARDHVDRTLGGMLTSPLSPGLVDRGKEVCQFVTVPLVLGGLYYLQRKRVQLSLAAKVGMAMVLMILPCLIMAQAALAAAPGARVSVLWMLGAQLAWAVPNVFLAPLMLSLISQLAPAHRLGTVFALWFTVSALASKLVVPLMNVIHFNYMFGPLWYGGLGVVALLAAGLWISQVRRLEAAMRPD